MYESAPIPEVNSVYSLGVQGWRSGESTRLPPLWLDSISRLASCVGWVCWFSTLHREVFLQILQGEGGKGRTIGFHWYQPHS